LSSQVRRWKGAVDEDLTEAIALAHDLGHTPFGHAGQDALNACMQSFGGFEHNLQSLRVVDVLEEVYADFPGLNLCFETREGILKHCSLPHARVLGAVGQRFLDRTQPSLEAQLTNIADEIAYNNHDIDDGLRSGLITLEQLCEVPLFASVRREVTGRYPQLIGGRLVHEILRRLISLMVTDLIQSSQAALGAAGVTDPEAVRAHGVTLMRYSPELLVRKNGLKRFLMANLYQHPQVYRMSWRAQKVVRGLFEVYMGDSRLLPPKYQQRIAEHVAHDGEAGKARAIADYIAGMTDRYALRQYAGLFGFSTPGAGF